MDVKKTERTTFIFTIWTLLYFLWFRWFMLVNWDFEIFNAEHWQFVFHQWWYGGWVIQGSYYWLFLLSVFLCIPVWIMGLCFLLSIDYKKQFEKLFWDVIYKKKTKDIQANDKRIRVRRKKSYKEVRPRALSGTPQKVAPIQSLPTDRDMMSDAPSAQSTSKDLFMKEGLPTDFGNTSFSHREVADDFSGSSPFASDSFGLSDKDFGSSDETKPLVEDMKAIMQDAGALVIENPKMDDEKIDYVAVANGQVFLVLTDNQKGDWLADEERFNDEDPLWFSETSHRISPITVLKKFEAGLMAKMTDAGIKAETHIILVKTDGNIINAEDMQDTWKQMDVLVARSATGTPEDLPSFTETFPHDLTAPNTDDAEKIQSFVQV